MGKHVRILMLVWLATAGLAGAQAPATLSGPALVEALRTGGYNIYFRHAATDWGQQDQVARPGDWTSCDPQRMRQLAPAGRVAAAGIGRAIRRLAIPVTGVLASQYCRTRETARLMDLGPVTPTLEIMNMRAAPLVGGREAVVARARRVLATPPPDGGNRVFVAHGNLLRAVSGAYTTEAGAAVFRPFGNGRLELVAELTPDDWTRLARQFGQGPD
jgi:hypothetical protein